jgi:hypothetical protein
MQPDANPLDTWAPPPTAPVHDHVESRKEDRLFGGAAPEPFVNETMAQLYLQQGYRQLAIKVYRQLLESRPNDQSLKDRIAQIESEDAEAAMRQEIEARREEPERPAEPSPRAPSIESPTPGRRESEERPSSRPSRDRESIESPARDEPRAEPDGYAARQPSIREFFATLGRRKPQRTGASARSQSGGNSGNQTADMSASMAGAGPSASLDTVFAGATVNPSDSRAASRLAGAFSGAPRSTTPQTPAMPTPRLNPRLQNQESEEDVAKFRAWLDGLTRE